MMHRATKTFLIIFLLTILALTAYRIFPKTNNNELIENDNHSDSASSPNKIGDAVKIRDLQVKVLAIENPHKDSYFYISPDDNNKYVAIHVIYSNKSSSNTTSYDQFDWQLMDADGYVYKYGNLGLKRPALSSGELDSGEKVRGWVTFEVRKTSKNFSAKFKPYEGVDDNAIIELF